MVAIEPVATPVATSMSVNVAVAVSVDAGETVSWSNAGFVIVAGLLSETVGEHFPDVPETLHDCPRATTGTSTMRELRTTRFTAYAPGERGTFPRRRFPWATARPNCP